MVTLHTCLLGDEYGYPRGVIRDIPVDSATCHDRLEEAMVILAFSVLSSDNEKLS